MGWKKNREDRHLSAAILLGTAAKINQSILRIRNLQICIINIKLEGEVL